MRPPKRVYVAGIAASVEFKKSLGDCFGRYFPGRDLVLVEQGQNPDQERDTVMHELVHVIENAMGIKFTEEEVSKLSHGLVSLLRLNPQLVKYLTDAN
jgi:Zn-dependent peptidase ImmA (M78 family)